MLGSTIRFLGNLAILAGVVILIYIFGPLVVQEAIYQVRPSGYFELADGPKNEVINLNPNKILTPANTDFAIIIPKIGANAPVIPNVDAGDPRIYQFALSRGVAHGAGSDTPNGSGNVFIFAHSAGNFLEASRYNAAFYLLNKLEGMDNIFVYYAGHKYTYRVTGKSIVSPPEATSLSKNFGTNTLTLMTCWPPGTTYKRLLVYAQKVN